MPMAADEIETMIRAAIPDAVIEITDLVGDGDHYSARVVSETFRGMPRVRQHQAVYAALGGRMGGAKTTVHNLKVLRVDAENHLLVVEGGIPGAPSSYVVLRKAVKAKRIKVAQVEKPKKGKK